MVITYNHNKKMIDDKLMTQKYLYINGDENNHNKFDQYNEKFLDSIIWSQNITNVLVSFHFFSRNQFSGFVLFT